LEQLQIKANIRKKTGNGPARELRREGKIPAVIYGPDTEPTLLALNISDLELCLKNRNLNQLLFNLAIEDGKTKSRSVMIKELQIHPVTRNYLHVDFYEINMNRKLKVPVQVVTKGISKGVELGGVLQIIRREIDVLCLPREIPESIEIDITDLDTGDSVHVNDIPLEGDIELPDDVNFTVLTILSPKIAEVEEEEGEEEEAEEAAEEEGETTEAGDEE
jgi:large subunit ribosomal protein L25